MSAADDYPIEANGYVLPATYEQMIAELDRLRAEKAAEDKLWDEQIESD